MSKSRIVHINLRLPSELHKRLIKAADVMDPPLSLNRTIIHILDDYLLQIEDLSTKAALAGRTMPRLTPDDMAQLEALFIQWFEKKEASKK